MIILGTNSIKDTGYDVANSLRFNSGSSDHLNRSTSSGDRLKWTWSAWLKKTKNGADEDLFSGYDNSSNFTRIQIGDTGRFNYINKTSGSQNAKIETNRVFRDNSAWYHFVIVWDTGNATAGNRMRIYVNGVEETSFANETQPSLNQVSHVNQASKTNYVGTFDGSGTFFNGYMAEVVLVDGQALDPTSFGEFDEDSPTIWKPKNVSGLTFGTNGLYLDFEDSSSLGNDAAGSNNFTVNNLTAVDQSTDTCTNNFATFNPLITTQSNSLPVFSEGNLTSTFDNGSTNEFALSTFAVSSGKWYAEFKWVDATGGGTTSVGIVRTDANFNQDVNDNGISYKGNGQKNIGGSSSSYGASYGTGNIISIALNMDDNQVTFYKDGASQGAISITADLTYFMYCTDYNNKSADANFGSPETSVSSGNADDNGYGNFEYDVPAGYYSLNTKNLAEYG